MVPSYLLSSLASRYGPRDFDAFKAAFPHPWLVWEPGPWLPVAAEKMTQRTVEAKPSQHRGAGAGSLAMHLKPTPGKAQLTLGRSDDNDVQINDATLSRTHLIFGVREARPWSVSDGGSMNGTWIDGLTLDPGKWLALHEGSRIESGQVFLTFHLPEGLFLRLASAR